MPGIDRVIARIQTIERRFSPGPIGANQSFAAVLSKAAASSGQGQAANSSVQAMVESAAKQQGVDPRLALAVAQAESGLDPAEISAAGAAGVMQLMPDTARSLGVSNPLDPQENIDGGVRYLKQMINDFGGDTAKALAAYNAGPAAVRRYGGVPPYGETQEYVAKVLDLYNRG